MKFMKYICISLTNFINNDYLYIKLTEYLDKIYIIKEFE